MARTPCRLAKIQKKDNTTRKMFVTTIAVQALPWCTAFCNATFGYRKPKVAGPILLSFGK